MAVAGSSALFSRLSYTRNVLKNGNKGLEVLSGSFNRSGVTPRFYTTGNARENVNEPGRDVAEPEKTSKAMRAYLERAKKHDEFIQKETLEFNIGKRHLANMMGLNPETITQEDIDESIEYLLPSGLFDKRARPMMRPPDQVFPKYKAAEFDASGRPLHSMFYTTKPNFFQVLYDIVEATNLLKKKKLEMDPRAELPPEEFNLSSTVWISKAELEQMLMEELIDREYKEFVTVLQRLVQYPGLNQVQDLLTKYSKRRLTLKSKLAIPPLDYNSDKRPFITVPNCMRKSSRAEVTVLGQGSGKITINGQNILYFNDVQAREQIIFPLIFTGLSGSVDVEAKVSGGGPSGQAGAIRWGISWALRSFVDPETTEKMRIAGLLKRDHRIRERKKPGQAGAREKFTWKKR
ncbi:28S ribosomal protein S9, mitochondrial-like isoform X2 [Diprion similis]|uniref:28S ribosomal protein S9, mitochondrial-like isoform X2 n=1 Tax=Diprion similis TaxID=362088 RepID=UPI001EF84366|nr:28S ribosomal protein S9, mitochondrial-like isoform X2 [Diprion similis]